VRVTSIDNDVADGLSRGGEQLQDALRIARDAGLPLLRLEVPPGWRCLATVVEVSRLAAAGVQWSTFVARRVSLEAAGVKENTLGPSRGLREELALARGP
jgi:hypothetical protein